MIKRKKGKQPIKRSIQKKGLYFGDYSLSDLGKLITEISAVGGEIMEDIKLSIVASMVGLVWLVQLKLVSNLAGQQIEKVPSYKHIKKSLISGNDAPVVAAAAGIAAIETIAYVDGMETEEDFNKYVNEIQETYTPNSKYIDQKTPSNYMIWTHGFMARQSGLFGSCPATNIKIFGLAQTCVDWGIDEVIQNLGPVAEGVTKENVINFLAKAVFEDSGGFTIQTLTFDEPALDSKIEQDVISGTPGFTLERTGDLVSTIPGKFTKDQIGDLKQYLKPIERLKLEQAQKLGMSKITNDLLEKASQMKAGEKASSSNGAAAADLPSGETTPRSGRSTPKPPPTGGRSKRNSRT